MTKLADRFREHLNDVEKRKRQKQLKQLFRHSSVLQCTLVKSSFLFFRFSLQMKYVSEKPFSSLSSKLDSVKGPSC